MSTWTPPEWSLQVENLGEESRVYLDGPEVNLDERETEVIERELFRLVEEGGRCRLLLDMANVAYLNSSTLSLLLRLNRKLQGMGGTLRLAHLQPQIHEIFRITRLDRVLDIRNGECADCVP